MRSSRPMTETPDQIDGPGNLEEATDNDIDIQALSPWPRLRGRPRHITYRQVFTRSFAVLAVVLGLLAIWSAIGPYTRPMEPFEKQLVPILLVVMPVLAMLAAAISALLLSTVWWFCWASWHPHVSDVPATGGASDGSRRCD